MIVILSFFYMGHRIDFAQVEGALVVSAQLLPQCQECYLI